MRALSVDEDVIKDISNTLKGILAVGEAHFESVEIQAKMLVEDGKCVQMKPRNV